MSTVYLDECVPHAVARRLRLHGHEVTTVQAEGTVGMRDLDQIHFATSKGWLILTTNEREFVGWHRLFHRNGWHHQGIILVSQRNVARLLMRSAMPLDWIGAEFPDTQNTLFRWTDLQQLLINGYVLKGYIEDELALALGRTP